MMSLSFSFKSEGRYVIKVIYIHVYATLPLAHTVDRNKITHHDEYQLRHHLLSRGSSE